MGNNVLIGNRSLDSDPLFVGEEVDVFIYRVFGINGNEILQIENSVLQDNYVII